MKLKTQITKSRVSWWLGLLVAIATAVLTYMSSCSTTTGLHITADSISNPNINSTDSTAMSWPKK